MQQASSGGQSKCALPGKPGCLGVRMVMGQNYKPAAAHGINKNTEYSKPWTGHAAHKRACLPCDLTAHILEASGKHHARSNLYCATNLTARSVSGQNKTSTQAVLSPALRRWPERGVLMIYRGPTLLAGANVPIRFAQGLLPLQSNAQQYSQDTCPPRRPLWPHLPEHCTKGNTSRKT